MNAYFRLVINDEQMIVLMIRKRIVIAEGMVICCVALRATQQITIPSAITTGHL